MRYIIGLVAMALLALPAGAEAAFRTIKAAEIVSIAPAEGGKLPRILVRWDLPADLAEKEIDGAAVRIKLATSGSGELPLEIHQLTRMWTAETASWSTGWSASGGDFTAKSQSPGLITERNEGAVRLDVSAAVKDQIAERVSNFGFIIVPRDGSERSLGAVSANDEPTLASAELVIAFRNKRH